MIDYEVLCQTIEDWRAGRRPSIDLSAAPADGHAEAEAADPYAADAGYDPNQYAEPQADAGYDPNQYAEPQADAGYDADQYAEPQADAGYDANQYAEQGYQQIPEAGYEHAEGYESGYDAGSPEPVEGGGTSPVDIADIEVDDPNDEYRS